jgi:hypothetical protein
VHLFDELNGDPGAVFASVTQFLGATPGVELAGPTASNVYRQYRFERIRNVMYGRRLWRFVPKPLARPLWKAFERPIAYPPLSAELRTRLEETFADDNRQLSSWLGIDLRSWSAAGAGDEGHRPS